mgnify:FL=1|tara:strand:+ start:260 stop:568 length:309 start_codon:yes stop_codon:yes gene_type:complete
MSMESIEYSIIQSILSINPKAIVSVEDDDVKKINWLETTPIAEEDILAKQKELKAEYEANKYQRDRALAYPSIVDQLDDLYHNGIDGWKTTIKAVKDKYPKG